MEIRKATTADYDDIIRLIPTEDELFLVYPKGKYPFTINQLHALAASRKELTVVVEDGKVIGFANLYDIRKREWAFIGNVVVAKRFRGQGIGRRLVSHMIQQARGKYDAREVRISVFNDNTPALLMYAGMGFEPYAVEARRKPSGRRVGLIHMQLKKREASPPQVDA